jgi:hypothetical protein
MDWQSIDTEWIGSIDTIEILINTFGPDQDMINTFSIFWSCKRTKHNIITSKAAKHKNSNVKICKVGQPIHTREISEYLKITFPLQVQGPVNFIFQYFFGKTPGNCLNKKFFQYRTNDRFSVNLILKKKVSGYQKINFPVWYRNIKIYYPIKILRKLIPRYQPKIEISEI